MLLKSTYNEFIKISAKPRSYLGLGAITILVGVILFALKADGLSFISFVTDWCGLVWSAVRPIQWLRSLPDPLADLPVASWRCHPEL